MEHNLLIIRCLFLYCAHSSLASMETSASANFTLSTNPPPKSNATLLIVIGSVFGVIVIIAFTGLIFYCVMSQKRKRAGDSLHLTGTQDSGAGVKTSQDQEPHYENQQFHEYVNNAFHTSETSQSSGDCEYVEMNFNERSYSKPISPDL